MRLTLAIEREFLFCCLHCSDLESAPDSVESTSQSNRLTLQDSSEHMSDNLQAASHDGENPGTMKTNDVTSDTPHSQSEQNSAPSANSDSSFDSISTSEATV